MKLNKFNSLYCPYCGSDQENENRFCIACGADISETAEEKSTNIRIITERPMNSNDYQRLNASSATLGSFAIQQASSTASGSSPVYSSTPKRTSNTSNATIAIILGIIGYSISCFIVPLVGLLFVRKAEEQHEDPSTIKIAKVLNWVQLILVLIGTVSVFVYYTVYFGFRFL